MNTIAARAGNDIDDAISGTSKLCCKTRGSDLELADGVFRQIAQCSAYDLIVIVPTIDRDVAAPPEPTRGAHLQRVGLGRVKDRSRTVARYQVREFEEVTSVEWNAFNGVCGDLPLKQRLL